MIESGEAMEIIIFSNSLKIVQATVPYPESLPWLVDGDEITIIFRRNGQRLAVSSAHLEELRK